MSDPLAHTYWTHKATQKKVRLQEVGYNPFTETKFVFFYDDTEAPRLGGTLRLKEDEFLEAYEPKP